jgi:hypothetical protein
MVLSSRVRRTRGAHGSGIKLFHQGSMGSKADSRALWQSHFFALFARSRVHKFNVNRFRTERFPDGSHMPPWLAPHGPVPIPIQKRLR